MTVQAQPGELLVGAYHRVISGCDLVSYNQRSREAGNQMELDVLAIRSENGVQTVYACEVVTHVDGMLYPGTPETDRWSELGNDDYQYTLQRVEEKLESDFEYVTDVFDSAHRYVFQLWSPVVPEGYRTDGLETLEPELESAFRSRLERSCSVDLIYNADYTGRIDELRDVASVDSKPYGNPTLRLLQILEHLREPS